MADYDYAPVASPDEEEEERRRLAVTSSPFQEYGGATGGAGAALGEYPPAAPAISVPASVRPNSEIAPEPSAPPAVGIPSSKGDDLNSSLAVGGSSLPLKGMTPAQTRLKALTDQGAPAVQPLHGWKKGLDIAGQILLPGVEQRLRYQPQNQYARNLKNAEGDLAAENTPAVDDAELRQKNALAGQEEAKATALRNPKNEIGKTPEETTIHDLMTGDNGKPRINPETNKPYDYLSAYSAVKQSATDAGKQQPPHITYDAGIPVSVVANGKTYDVNDPKLPPELKPLVDAANRAHGQHVTEDSDKAAKAADRAAHANDTKRSAGEMVTVEREARAAVHKAETDYNNARSTVAMQRELIKEAKGGNKEAVRMVPLEGALEITTSQGVHRINKTEVEQYGKAGSFYDRIVGAIGGGVSGKNIPDSVLNDMDAMTKELSKNAHERYKREYDYNKQVVEGYGGKDFDKRVPMVQAEEEGGSQSAKDFGAAPAGKTDGSTGTLPDGTKVVVKGGRLISQ